LKIGYLRQGMHNHPDIEQLSLCRDGLLSEVDGRIVRDHLGWCLACARLNRQLADVASRLADTRMPPMPNQVTTRIDQALTAEAVGRRPAFTAPSGTV
jgi:hypothetical protein